MFSSSKKIKPLSKADVTTGLARTKWEPIYRPMLPQLQSRFPEGEDPEELLRVLAEWEGNVDLAEKKYRETQEWRRTHLPIKTEAIRAGLATSKCCIHGFDRQGRPVAYFRTALHDPKQFTPQETVDMVIHETEKLFDKIKAKTDPAYANVQEVMVMVDRTDATMKNTDVEFLKMFYNTLKDHYPSRGEVFVIYNVNIVFRTMWALVKPFIDPKSQGRTYMVNTKEELLEFISEDQLADFMGGRNPFDFGSQAGEPEQKS